MRPGPLMLDLEGLVLSRDEQTLLQHPMVGGVIFFARNFSSRQQITELSQQILSVRPDLLLAVDQEGGRVQRFKEGFTRLPPMALLGEQFEKNPEFGAQLLQDCGWLMAVEVLACGVDFSFAPVLDIDRDTCEVIADRSFSCDPEIATLAAGYFIDGLHQAGMAATGKHFPGHGGVVADSHLETPVDMRTMEQLQARDLVPFDRLSGKLDAVMPAHIQFPHVDRDCVGFSHLWLQSILRGQYGFNGVIFSDDLSMKGADAVGGYPQKAEKALAAGCDMVLVCNNRDGALEVLHYLEKEKPAVSPRLPSMKARKNWQWDDLVVDQRRKSIQDTLVTLFER